MATSKDQQVSSDASATATEMLSVPQTTLNTGSNQEMLETRLGLLDSLCSNFSDNPRKRQRHSPPPEGLTTPCNDLYTLLHPCLVERNPKSNVAALVMGKRGTGKTLVVEHAIQSLLEQNTFRVVKINGLLIRGDDVSFAVREIIRQLSDMAMSQPQNVTKKRMDLLRLRTSSFTSNLALLDEVLRMACVDGIPILIVLDELDAFLGSSASLLELKSSTETSVVDRQLLLYHLLDRVTTQGTLMSLIGITSHLACVSMLEKRVKSRAEGTCKIIFLNPSPTFDKLVAILLSKLCCSDNSDGGKELQDQVKSIIKANDENESEDEMTIAQVLRRNFALGKDVRWFCRVLSCALAFYREDVASLLRRDHQQQQNDTLSPSTSAPAMPSLAHEHFWEALVIMNASFPASLKQRHSSDNGATAIIDFRMQALLDLSSPQVALVLAAKRILARDGHSEDSAASPKPLTLERMLQEYESYRGPHRFHPRLLVQSFYQLLDTDVMRPSADHAGGGPLQYNHLEHYQTLDESTIRRMPLHLPMDIDTELGEALKQNLLECSTSLREWGRKKN
jgi:hypothetical protein